MIVVTTLKRLMLALLVVAVAAAGLLSLRPDEIRYASAPVEQETPTLIIDAGHGGADGGAVSVNGVNESVINLDIAKKMAVLAEFASYPVLLTREGEELVYPEDCKTIAEKKRYDQKQRVEYINTSKNAVVLSVHQNSFPNSRPYGPQTFYNTHEPASSLGVVVQDYLNAALCPENRRLAAPVAKDIYLMKKIDCPGVLVECGFVSNAKEAALLETEQYRLKIACAVMSAYISHISTEDEIR